MSPSESKQDDIDSKILSLATQIADSPDQNVPLLLLKLKEILGQESLGRNELKKLKEDIYSCGLTEYCNVVLKKDFSKIQGGWSAAAQLADILSKSCVDIDPEEEKEKFHHEVLPKAADNLLNLARRIQKRYERAVKDEEKAELYNNFHIVTNSVCWLCSGRIDLAKQTLQSEDFHQLLLTDDVKTRAIMMSVLENLVRVNSAVLTKTDEKAIRKILDELVYNLLEETNPVIGSLATKALLLMARRHPPIVKIICTHYKALQIQLSKKWTGKGFGRELHQLLDLLYAGSYQQGHIETHDQVLHRAACLIQAAWRAYQTRKRLKKLPKAITRIQKSFRERKAKERLLSQRLKEEEELRHHVQLQRQRALREFRQRQLDLLEIVPASLVDVYLREQEQKAAILIQKLWRGHRERRKFHDQKRALKEFKAAVTLQRAALRFLQRRRNERHILSPWRGPKGLTDERRTELKKEVEDYIALHPCSSVSMESCKELHQKTQEMLRQHVMKRHPHRKANQRREALLAQINTDIELLMNSPHLQEVTKPDIDAFTSRSGPVAARAKECHHTMLQFNRWPWWKKLGDEFLDPEKIPKEDINTEFETLYLGGS
ncbi:IQCB1 protein, partial [Atractosteus spatula]|nr:IQCB1 protein [Atractosteus spatula]